MKRGAGRAGVLVGEKKKKKTKIFFKERIPFAALGGNSENLVQKRRLKSSYFHIYNV